MTVSSSLPHDPTVLDVPGGAPIAWRSAIVVDILTETPRTRTLVLELSGWPGHRAGQHVDVRLTAEDGYQAQRSYSIASAPQDARIALTVDRLDDGEVSPYLTDVLRKGDRLELRGPIGGYFVWDVAQGRAPTPRGGRVWPPAPYWDAAAPPRCAPRPPPSAPMSNAPPVLLAA